MVTIDLNKKISDISETDIYVDISEKFTKSLIANGQSMSEKEIEYSCKMLVQTIKDRYKHLNYGNINNAFRRGVAGDFDKVMKITVITINGWISRVNSEVQESNRIRLASKKSVEETMKIIKNDGWGAAILKRNELINSGKDYNQKYRDREKYSLKKIREMMRNNEI
jgi:hypothetical protein